MITFPNCVECVKHDVCTYYKENLSEYDMACIKNTVHNAVNATPFTMDIQISCNAFVGY